MAGPRAHGSASGCSQDPGAAGKADAATKVKLLAGYDVIVVAGDRRQGHSSETSIGSG